LIWQADLGLDLLAEADGKAYILTSDRKMVVMENQTGKQLHAVNFAGVSVYATNLTDSSIYVSDDAGLVACLRPVK
jgi:hypothetical protein